MKKRFAWLLCLVLRPSIVGAHGGYQRVSGNTIVTYYPKPIAPLIGEPVVQPNRISFPPSWIITFCLGFLSALLILSKKKLTS